MKQIISIILILIIMSTNVQAKDMDRWQESSKKKVEQAAPDEIQNMLEEIDFSDSGGMFEGVDAVLSSVGRKSRSLVSRAALSMLRILAVLILCKLMDQVCGDRASAAVRLIGALAVTAEAAADVKTLLGLGMHVMEEINTFSAVLLPVLAAASAASGAVSGSRIFYSLTVLFSDVLIRLCKTALLPLVYSFVVLAAADSALGGSRLKKLRELLGWCITSGLKILVGAFTSFLAVTGILSGAADSLTLKTAKLSFSTLIPVVGGILSDASDTLLTSAGLLKNAVGTYGMLVILGIFALPFVSIGVSFLSFKVASALGGVLESAQSGLLDTISAAMGYVLAMVSSCAFMSLMACCCFMKAVNG